MLEGDNALLSVGLGVGDNVWNGVSETRALPDWTGVRDTEIEGEPEADEDTEIHELGELEKLDELDSTGVNV